MTQSLQVTFLLSTPSFRIRTQDVGMLYLAQMRTNPVLLFQLLRSNQPLETLNGQSRLFCLVIIWPRMRPAWKQCGSLGTRSERRALLPSALPWSIFVNPFIPKGPHPTG